MSQNVEEITVPWRERAFVPVSEAAQILGRSTTWVRNRITDRQLDAASLPGKGSAAVTVASILRIVAAASRARPETYLPPPHARPNRPRELPLRTGKLRLVVDNTRP